jgi:hypothetical protein
MGRNLERNMPSAPVKIAETCYWELKFPTPTDIHGEKGQASTNVANRAGIATASLVRAKGDVHAQPGVAFPGCGLLAGHARNKKA